MRFSLRRPAASRAASTHPGAGSSVGGAVGAGAAAAGAGGVAAAAAGAAEPAVAGGLAMGLGRMLKGLTSGSSLWMMTKLAAAAYLLNEVMKFGKETVNGVPFATGGAVPPDRLAAAANANNRRLPEGAPAQHAVPSAQPTVDPRVHASLSTVAGRDAIKASQSLDVAVNGQTESNRMVYADGHAPVPGQERAVLEAHREALGSNANANLVRLTIPGGNGRTVDFQAGGAVNDRAALDAFHSAYPELARKNGLPPQIPAGASIIVGRKDDVSDLIVGSQPREYRFVADDRFQRNSNFQGSFDAPGPGSFADGVGYRDGSRRFDLAEISAGDRDIVRAADVAGQARESSLIVHREPYLGAVSKAVTTPVAMMDGLLGRQGGSAFADLASSVGPHGNTMLVQSLDLADGKRAVGVVGREGSAVLGTGRDGDFIDASHKDYDGLLTHVRSSGPVGSLGAFAAGGQFVGTERAGQALSDVGTALDRRRDSPVLNAAKSARLAGEKDLTIDLTPGQESVTTRLHFPGRIVDYAAREGQMTMIERDPVSGSVREAAMIRSRGIHVDAKGHVAMDLAARQVLDEHVATYASGRSGAEFARSHPVEASQFASLRDAPAAHQRTGSVAALPSVPEVETTGSARTVREGGLERSREAVPVYDDVTPRRAAASGRGLGD